MAEITVYGLSGCVASWDIRRLFDSMKLPYRFVDLETDAEAKAWALDLGGGKRLPALPIVRLADGRTLIGATRREVAGLYGIRLDTGLLRPMITSAESRRS
jgi:glutaredoxin